MIRDNLAEWLWSLGSEEPKDVKPKKQPLPENKNDKWIRDNILDVSKSKYFEDQQAAIDNRLHLLREWIRMLRYRGNSEGQVVIVEKINSNGNVRRVTHDIRNFEAFCRFKEKNYVNSVLRKIL